MILRDQAIGRKRYSKTAHSTLECAFYNPQRFRGSASPGHAVPVRDHEQRSSLAALTNLVLSTRSSLCLSYR